jgi:hypothetical protein
MENLRAAQLPGEYAGAEHLEDALVDAYINEADHQHLESFPNERKATLIQRILSRAPDKSIELGGKLDFERTLRRLRRDGYALIDMQLHETAFSSIWFRKSNGVMDWRRIEVAMVLWELRGGDCTTTVQSWFL